MRPGGKKGGRCGAARGRGKGKGGKFKGLFAAALAVAAGSCGVSWFASFCLRHSGDFDVDACSEASTSSEETWIGWPDEQAAELELGSGGFHEPSFSDPEEAPSWWIVISRYVAWPTRYVACPAWQDPPRPHLVVDTDANHGLGGRQWYDDFKAH